MIKTFAGNDRKRWWTSSCTASRPSRSATFSLIGIILFHLLLPSAAAEPALTLRDAITAALEHSHTLEASLYDSSAVALRQRAAQALRYPTLSLQAAGFYLDELQSVEVGVMQMEIGSRENYQADIRLSLPLFTGGKITNAIRQQREYLMAAGYGVEVSRLQVAYSCRRTYLTLMLTDHLLEAEDASLKRINIIWKNVVNLYANGMADSLDILDVALAIEQAQRQQENKCNERENTAANLSRITGLTPLKSGGLLVAVDSLPTPVRPSSRFELAAASETNRPELKLYAHRIRAADRQAALAAADHFPDLLGYVAYHGGKPNRNLFSSSFNDFFSVGATLSWDLNLGLKNIKESRAARFRASSLSRQRNDIAESLRLQHEIAVNNLEHAYDSYLSVESEYLLSQRKFHLAEKKQQAGRMTINRLLEIEAELATREALYQAAKVHYYLAITNYLYAIGSDKIYGGL